MTQKKHEAVQNAVECVVSRFDMQKMWQLTNALVFLVQICAVRNIFVEKAFSPAHFLDHTEFDCGRLD